MLLSKAKVAKPPESLPPRAFASTMVCNKLSLLLPLLEPNKPPVLLEEPNKPPLEEPCPFSPPRAATVANPLPRDVAIAVSVADMPVLRSNATAATGSSFPEVTELRIIAFFKGSLELSSSLDREEYRGGAAKEP